MEGKNDQIKKLQSELLQAHKKNQLEEGKEPMIQIQLAQEKRLRKFYQNNLL